MSFSGKLGTLGFATYNDYLQSEHWVDFKSRYTKSHYPQNCQGCSAKSAIELHHTTYKRIGEEKLTDVMPLCRQCHQKVHDILREANKRVEETSWALKKFSQQPIRKQHPKQNRKDKQQKQKKKSFIGIIQDQVTCIVCKVNLAKRGFTICKSCVRSERIAKHNHEPSESFVEARRKAQRDLQEHRNLIRSDPLALAIASVYSGGIFRQFASLGQKIHDDQRDKAAKANRQIAAKANKANRENKAKAKVKKAEQPKAKEPRVRRIPKINYGFDQATQALQELQR